MIEQVNPFNIDDLMARYAKARGGERNEQTDSEAMFVGEGMFQGVWMLSTHVPGGPVWVGVQNASARATDQGCAFPTVRAAVEAFMKRRGLSIINVYYTDTAVERLRWMADTVEKHYASGICLLVAESK